MTAERAAVIEFRPRRGRPSKEQTTELDLELSARQLEERRFAREAEPLLRRLAFAAVGRPQTLATVQHLQYLHSRHRARWTHEPEGDAA